MADSGSTFGPVVSGAPPSRFVASEQISDTIITSGDLLRAPYPLYSGAIVSGYGVGGYARGVWNPPCHKCGQKISGVYIHVSQTVIASGVNVCPRLCRVRFRGIVSQRRAVVPPVRALRTRHAPGSH